MPTSQESAKSKSWSLRSMLGRKGSTKDKNKDKNNSSNGRRNKSGVEESSQQSIKERVLAKLKEPLSLPNACELKAAAARHSVDSFRLESQLDREEEEYGRYYSSHSRYSVSSSNLESNSCAFNQASTTPSSARSRSTALQAACSSPTSNVIARLMGLGDAQQIMKPARNSIHLRRQQQQQDEEGMWRSPRKSSSVEGSPRSQLLEPKQQSRIRIQKRKDCAQDFLDEMEDHLRQCDKALERIEAVMQLKKKLLYLNSRAHNFDQHYNYNNVDGSQLGRASSMDGRSDRHHHRQQQQQQAFTSMETPPSHRSFQHRRSVSEGESPVFRPSAFDFELDISRSMEAHRDSFRKRAETTTVELSDHSPRTPPVLQHHKQRMKTTPKISLREETAAGATAATSESNSEQPSPVSVLDNNNPGYDSASEEDRDSTHKEIKESNNHAAVDRKKFVVRALWKSEESSGDSTAPTSTSNLNRSSNKVDDAEVMKRIDGIWSRGMRGEISEVAMVVEGIIFRRLVEETIDDLLCFALP